MIGSNIRAVIFDHDDTLVATIESKWAEHKHVAATHYGVEITDDILRAHWGKPLGRMVSIMYETDDADAVINRLISVQHNFPKRLFPETVPTLERLKARGLPLGLVTAHSRIGIAHDFTDLELHPHDFEHIQTYEDTEHHKPDARVFEPTLKWLGRIGLSADQAVYVADGLHDYEAARGAGINFIGVTTGLVPAEDFRRVGAPVVNSLAEL